MHFLKFNLYYIFLHHHLSLLYPPPRSNHHTVVHVYEALFLFAQSLHPLSAPHQLSSDHMHFKELSGVGLMQLIART